MLTLSIAIFDIKAFCKLIEESIEFNSLANSINSSLMVLGNSLNNSINSLSKQLAIQHNEQLNKLSQINDQLISNNKQLKEMNEALIKSKE